MAGCVGTERFRVEVSAGCDRVICGLLLPVVWLAGSTESAVSAVEFSGLRSADSRTRGSSCSNSMPPSGALLILGRFALPFQRPISFDAGRLDAQEPSNNAISSPQNHEEN